MTHCLLVKRFGLYMAEINLFYYLYQQTNTFHIVEMVTAEDGRSSVVLPILAID